MRETHSKVPFKLLNEYSQIVKDFTVQMCNRIESCLNKIVVLELDKQKLDQEIKRLEEEIVKKNDIINALEDRLKQLKNDRIK